MSTPAWASPATPTVRIPGTSDGFDLNDLKDDRTPEKLTITVYGAKDAGKSTVLFGLPGRKFVVALDGQSKRARDNSIHKGDPNIRVFNAYKHYDENNPPSAKKTVQFIEWGFDNLVQEGWNPDWIIYDAFDIQTEVADRVMRANHGLLPSDSFANRNLWKERNAVVRGLWRRALGIARLGVGYGTYYKSEVLERDATGGELLTLKGPKWMDLIEHETVITVEVTKSYNVIAKREEYKAKVSSKLDNPDDVVGCVFKSGDTFDLTDKKFPWDDRLAKFLQLANTGRLAVPGARSDEVQPNAPAATAPPPSPPATQPAKKVTTKW